VGSGAGHFRYILTQRNVSDGNHLGSFCGKQNVHLNQKRRQFRDYIM